MDYLIEFINWIIAGTAATLEWLFGVLPQSPLEDFTANSAPSNVNLGYITWFIPFPTMLLHFAVILTAIGIYYVFRIIARWLKVVRG